MSVPEISVVITIYREGDLLAESLESVLAQTFRDFEIVLVDNNASPGTRSVAEKFRSLHSDIIRIVHEPNQGVASGKYRGVLESRGKFIALLDGDDLMKPERLERQYGILRERPDLSLVTSTYDRLSHDSKRVIEENIWGPTRASEMWRNLEREMANLYRTKVSSECLATFGLTIPSTFFFRRETAIQAGNFELRLNPRWCEDYEFQIRMFGFGAFYRIPESLIFYRTNSPESHSMKTSQFPSLERYLHDQRFFTILWECFGGRDARTDAVLKRIRALWLRYVGLHFIQFGKCSKIGAMLLRRALLAHPFDIESLKYVLKTFFPRSLYPRLFWFAPSKEDGDPIVDPSFGRTFLEWPPCFPGEAAVVNGHYSFMNGRSSTEGSGEHDGKSIPLSRMNPMGKD